jgi:hypothetical protein
MNVIIKWQNLITMIMIGRNGNNSIILQIAISLKVVVDTPVLIYRTS